MNKRYFCLVKFLIFLSHKIIVHGLSMSTELLIMTRTSLHQIFAFQSMLILWLRDVHQGCGPNKIRNIEIIQRLHLLSICVSGMQCKNNNQQKFKEISLFLDSKIPISQYSNAPHFHLIQQQAKTRENKVHSRNLFQLKKLEVEYDLKTQSSSNKLTG